MIGNRQRGMILQDRDRHLFEELAIMRVIDREQARCVAGFKSTTRANSRLLLLSRAGLLRRFFLGTSGGGRKALYALSPTGAKLVQTPLRGPRRGRDETLVADFFATHQLKINEIYCALKFQPIPIEGAKFLRWVSFSEPLEAGTSLIPDGYVEVRTPAKTLSAFLEVDLGHESRSIWRSKVRGYLNYAISGAFSQRFSQPQFRVLTIANSERRLRSLRVATALLTDRIFWFTTFDSIAREGFWSPIWLRSKDGLRLSLA
jgi:Replication-relaxation